MKIIGYYNIPLINTSTFAMVQMLYPAFAAIIMMKYVTKIELKKPLRKFFNLYMFITILSIVILIFGTFSFPEDVSTYLNIISAINSISVICIILSDKERAFDTLKITFRSNIKKVIVVILIFIGLVVAQQIVTGLNRESITELARILGMMPMMLFINLFLASILFIG